MTPEEAAKTHDPELYNQACDQEEIEKLTIELETVKAIAAETKQEAMRLYQEDPAELMDLVIEQDELLAEAVRLLRDHKSGPDTTQWKSDWQESWNEKRDAFLAHPEIQAIKEKHD